MKTGIGFIVVVCVAILIAAFGRKEGKAEEAANQFMEYCNKHKVKAGCFYVINDSVVVTKKNF